MISGSVWNRRSSSRASRIASSHSGARSDPSPARIAFVEHQIDHRRDGGEALGALGRARRLERHVGFGDARLGAGDALLHGRLADQEGARDLLDLRPETMRSASAICWVVGSSGWQQMNSSRSTSSR